MAETTVPELDYVPEPVHRRRPLWQRIAKWGGIVLGGILLLLAALLLALNTSPGKRFLADQISGFTLPSGLNIRIGRIEGSIWLHQRSRHCLPVRPCSRPRPPRPSTGSWPAASA